jgi:hypothetical protein
MMVTPYYVKWVPCHHGMAHLQVADDRDGLQICRVAADSRKGVVLQLLVWA